MVLRVRHGGTVRWYCMMVHMVQVQGSGWYKTQGTHGTLQNQERTKKTQPNSKKTQHNLQNWLFFLQIGCVFFSYGRMGTVVPYDRSVPYPHTIGPYLRTIGPYPPYRTPVPHRRTHSVPMYQVMVPHHRTHTVSFFQKPYLAIFLDLDK